MPLKKAGHCKSARRQWVPSLMHGRCEGPQRRHRRRENRSHRRRPTNDVVCCKLQRCVLALVRRVRGRLQRRHRRSKRSQRRRLACNVIKHKFANCLLDAACPGSHACEESARKTPKKTPKKRQSKPEQKQSDSQLPEDVSLGHTCKRRRHDAQQERGEEESNTEDECVEPCSPHNPALGSPEPSPVRSPGAVADREEIATRNTFEDGNKSIHVTSVNVHMHRALSY